MSSEAIVILVGRPAPDLRQAVIDSKGVSVLLCPSVSAAVELLNWEHTSASARTVVEAGNLRLDTAAFDATVDDRPFHLTPREFSVLADLALDIGRVRSFTRLLERGWPPAVTLDGDVSLVHSAVKRLRRKLESAGADARIESVRGIGLRLALPVVLPEAAPKIAF